MAKLYSIDLRERVAAFAIAHRSANLAARTFSVSKATAVRWAKQLRIKGHVKPGKVGGHNGFAAGPGRNAFGRTAKRK